jgi:hypothetical protein
MKCRKIRGVLHNFLATYSSRYSDYDGYWLFGVLAQESGHLQIDLVNPDQDPQRSALT